MHIEAYERLKLDVTRFDTEDVITTSVIGPNPPGFVPGEYEQPGGNGNGPIPGGG